MGCALSGCSWAAERSWHAPSSHGLRRLRLRSRQAWWWIGCRPCLPSSFDRAAVICYRATVASINLWHMHTCTLTTTDLPLLCIKSHSFRLERARRNIVYWECLCLLLDLSLSMSAYERAGSSQNIQLKQMDIEFLWLLISWQGLHKVTIQFAVNYSVNILIVYWFCFTGFKVK